MCGERVGWSAGCVSYLSIAKNNIILKLFVIFDGSPVTVKYNISFTDCFVRQKSPAIFDH
jgi:hypothetical protein